MKLSTTLMKVEYNREIISLVSSSGTGILFISIIDVSVKIFLVGLEFFLVVWSLIPAIHSPKLSAQPGFNQAQLYPQDISFDKVPTLKTLETFDKSLAFLWNPW